MSLIFLYITNPSKAEGKNYGKIVKEIEKIHPYDVPCIIKLSIAANQKYAKWLASVL